VIDENFACLERETVKAFSFSPLNTITAELCKMLIHLDILAVTHCYLEEYQFVDTREDLITIMTDTLYQ